MPSLQYVQRSLMATNASTARAHSVHSMRGETSCGAGSGALRDTPSRYDVSGVRASSPTSRRCGFGSVAPSPLPKADALDPRHLEAVPPGYVQAEPELHLAAAESDAATEVLVLQHATRTDRSAKSAAIDRIGIEDGLACDPW